MYPFTLSLGLVYDWIDRFNLYYSTTIGYIYLKNIKDTSVRRIISSSTEMMKDLVLMPHDRYIEYDQINFYDIELTSYNRSALVQSFTGDI